MEKIEEIIMTILIPNPNPTLAPFDLLLIISLEWGGFRGKFFAENGTSKTMMEPFLKVRYSIMALDDTNNPWRACHELLVPPRYIQKKEHIYFFYK